MISETYTFLQSEPWATVKIEIGNPESKFLGLRQLPSFTEERDRIWQDSKLVDATLFLPLSGNLFLFRCHLVGKLEFKRAAEAPLEQPRIVAINCTWNQKVETRLHLDHGNIPITWISLYGLPPFLRSAKNSTIIETLRVDWVFYRGESFCNVDFGGFREIHLQTKRVERLKCDEDATLFLYPHADGEETQVVETPCRIVMLSKQTFEDHLAEYSRQVENQVRAESPLVQCLQRSLGCDVVL
jgi:hypothetical protein